MFKTILRIMDFSGIHKKTVQKAFYFSMLTSLCNILPFFALFLALRDLFVQEITLNTIFSTFAILFIGVVGKIFLGALTSRYRMLASYSMCAQKRMELGERLKRIPLGYFDTHQRGKFISVLSTNINEVEFLGIVLLDKVSTGIAYTFALSGILLILDWRIGIINILGLLTALALYGFIDSQAEKVAPYRQKTQNSLIESVLEYCRGIAVVRAFGTQSSAATTVINAVDNYSHASEKVELTFVCLGGLYHTILKISSCFIVGISCWLWLQGAISATLCMLFLLSSFTLYIYVENFGILSGMSRIIGMHLDAVEELNTLPLLDERGTDLTPKHYAIDMKNVSFSYGEKPVLQNITLHIPQGSTTALVGPSGSGKTSLCRLIARFWDVQKGSVSVGGYDVKDYTCESLLQNMSIVFQDVFLFEGTILENICFGLEKNDLEKAQIAAQKACCHDFIMRLPQGYDTPIGEGGARLSGGERQRISLARAIMKNAPIIILDEATASIDPESEYIVQKVLEELTKHKTVITIAHKLDTIRNADQIIVLDKGLIVQRGRHEELLTKEGVYSRFLEARQDAMQWTL